MRVLLDGVDAFAELGHFLAGGVLGAEQPSQQLDLGEDGLVVALRILLAVTLGDVGLDAGCLEVLRRVGRPLMVTTRSGLRAMMASRESSSVRETTGTAASSSVYSPGKEAASKVRATIFPAPPAAATSGAATEATVRTRCRGLLITTWRPQLLIVRGNPFDVLCLGDCVSPQAAATLNRAMLTSVTSTITSVRRRRIARLLSGDAGIESSHEDDQQGCPDHRGHDAQWQLAGAKAIRATTSAQTRKTAPISAATG